MNLPNTDWEFGDKCEDEIFEREMPEAEIEDFLAWCPHHQIENQEIRQQDQEQEIEETEQQQEDNGNNGKNDNDAQNKQNEEQEGDENNSETATEQINEHSDRLRQRDQKIVRHDAGDSRRTRGRI